MYKLFILLLLMLPAMAEDKLRLATTTSLENSGLLEYLLPAFEEECTCRVHVIPVGTGKALELGRRGDVDALLVHAPAAEEQFIAEGYGIGRQLVAYNYFILLTPPADPAGVEQSNDLLAALHNIAHRKARFLSRGDESGTHKKEQTLWQQLQQEYNITVTYSDDWYIEAGSGMGQAILMANELQAYVLSDSGTYLHLRDKINLRPAPPLKKSQRLYNPYSIIRINPSRYPHVNSTLAQQFADWLGQAAVQQRIGDYKLAGESLFIPADK